MDAILTYLRDHWIKFVVCILIGATPLLIYLGSKNGWTSSYAYMDGCFIGAATLLGIGFLAIINNFGGFDLFSFYFRRHKTENGPEDFGDYVQRKGQERVKLRWGFLPYFVIGVCYLIPSIVLMILR